MYTFQRFVSLCCGQLTSHDEEEEHHDEGVTKVKQVAECTSDGSFVSKVVKGE